MFQRTSDNFSLNSQTDISGNISTDYLDNSSKYIKVVCRVRPLNSKEREINNDKTIVIPTDKKDSLFFKKKNWKFDLVIPETEPQSYLYETVAKPIINDVLNGFNGTIFAYGQTSSGKTFTMEGVLGNDELEGIIPRISRDIFNHITFENNNNLKIITKVSSFQLYMEKIQDMLDESKGNLSIHEDGNKDFFIKNLTVRYVYNSKDLLNEFKKGQVNRKTCATKMNEVSSRSHSIFQIEIRQENAETGIVLNGKLFLVDLAGSETISKTKADGIVMRESCEINKSLFELKKVIKLISCNKQEPFIYRNSKLTKILKESLGGNSITTMIICCSPSTYNENETERTLRFGSMTKRIKNQVTVNEELTIEKWKELCANDEFIMKNLELQLEAINTNESVSENSGLDYLQDDHNGTEIQCNNEEMITKMMGDILELGEYFDNIPTIMNDSLNIEKNMDEYFLNLKNRILSEIKIDEEVSRLLEVSCEQENSVSLCSESDIEIPNDEEITLENAILLNDIETNEKIIRELKNNNLEFEKRKSEWSVEYNELKSSTKDILKQVINAGNLLEEAIYDKENELEKINLSQHQFKKLVVDIDQKFYEKITLIRNQGVELRSNIKQDSCDIYIVHKILNEIVNSCTMDDMQEFNEIEELLRKMCNLIFES